MLKHKLWYHHQLLHHLGHKYIDDLFHCALAHQQFARRSVAARVPAGTNSPHQRCLSKSVTLAHRRSLRCSPIRRLAVSRAPRGFLEESGVEGNVGAKVLVGVDEASSMRVEVDDPAEEHALGSVTRAVAHQVHDGFGLAALVVEVQTVQAAGLIDERDGVEERSVHVLRGAGNGEGRVVF